MPDAHANLAVSTVATAPSPAASGTSLVVATGEGARFPTAPFNATVWPADALADPSNAEIVRVTARSTDTLTITRAQESTSARSIVVGDLIAATITAKTLTDIEDALGDQMGIGSQVIVFPLFDHTDIAGTFIFVADAANQALGGYVQNSSTHAQNDEVSLGSIYLGAGTWVADCYGVSGSDRAIWTIRLDSTDTATADFYTASLTFNKKVTSSSFSVASAGSKTLSVKAATKNASGSNYYLTMTMIVCRRTA